jgi:hypothetical protein
MSTRIWDYGSSCFLLPGFHTTRRQQSSFWITLHSLISFRLLFGLPFLLLFEVSFFSCYFPPHFAVSVPYKPLTLDSFNNRSFHFHAPQYSMQSGRLQRTEGELLAPQNLYAMAEEWNPGPQDKGVGLWASIPSPQKMIRLLKLFSISCDIFISFHLFSCSIEACFNYNTSKCQINYLLHIQKSYCFRSIYFRDHIASYRGLHGPGAGPKKNVFIVAIISTKSNRNW